jgi:hypothetical protein
MKKTLTKLTLKRDILRVLSPEALVRVDGGGGRDTIHIELGCISTLHKGVERG